MLPMPNLRYSCLNNNNYKLIQFFRTTRFILTVELLFLTIRIIFCRPNKNSIRSIYDRRLIIIDKIIKSKKDDYVATGYGPRAEKPVARKIYGASTRPQEGTKLRGINGLDPRKVYQCLLLF